ncbi:hypothetical protein Agabi119p4_540 [Agaricus bisporus var. burnettii]|uniref:Uncharacterized protein n=1 Tax=Agaricus bisporus var. burnettii TaxID=192524 RepID=A0A8H7KKW8_AGABI|nr:hypothetical protein Agabi119p4_540 [Agaricus bisporus var. burnettii]
MSIQMLSGTPFSLSPQPGKARHYSSSSIGDLSSGLPTENPITGKPPVATACKYFAHASSSSKLRISHPYARLYAKKDETKRRRIWNHALEKLIFSPYELSILGAPHRRTIYLASLEAHIDRIHAQLSDVGCCPVSVAELEPFRGLNSKTAKSMVSGLQHEVSVAKLKLLELERANAELECLLHGWENGS